MEMFLATLFVVIALLLIIVVLLQKGRGGGLGAAFSGGGSAAFGTRTGDVFTWVTIVLTALYLLVAITTTLVYRPSGSAAPVQRPGAAKPAAPPSPEETAPPPSTTTAPGGEAILAPLATEPASGPALPAETQ